jgi:hypothetical protein
MVPFPANIPRYSSLINTCSFSRLGPSLKCTQNRVFRFQIDLHHLELYFLLHQLDGLKLLKYPNQGILDLDKRKYLTDTDPWAAIEGKIFPRIRLRLRPALGSEYGGVWSEEVGAVVHVEHGIDCGIESTWHSRLDAKKWVGINLCVCLLAVIQVSFRRCHRLSAAWYL